MSAPKLSRLHSATKAVDELFNQIGVERTSKPTSPYTKSDYPSNKDEYTYYHFRIHVNFEGEKSNFKNQFYKTSNGVVYIEEIIDNELTDDKNLLAIVDTKAQSKEDHPAYN